MDYTTEAEVKSALGAQTNVDDDYIDLKITEASRWIDRYCSSSVRTDVLDYLKLESIENEILSGFPTRDGRILCYPHKPIITGVTSFSWGRRPDDEWHVVTSNLVICDDMHTVEAFAETWEESRVRVRISYSGGLGTCAVLPETPTPADVLLPLDVVNAATVLTVRLYKEEKSGLSDTIGVAELGRLQYTKAMPERVRLMFQPYVRKVPW